MRIIECHPEDPGHADHRDAVLALINHSIVHTTAIYDYAPRSAARLDEWFAAKHRDRFPVLGLLNDDDQLVGFGSFGPFRDWPAYKYTVEHSLYLDEAVQGRGWGRRLLEALVTRAHQQGRHVMVAGIDADNAASIRLHERAGFERVGTLPQVGFKFDRWLDLCFYQLTLDTPRNPVDG
ncbi:MAG: N-acetyltransferase family protein [Planctomycetota bacterium]